MKRNIVFSIILVIVLLCSSSYAGVPLETLKLNVNKVLNVLRDPDLKSPAKKELKKEKLRRLYFDMFDEVELAKRSLSRNWRKLTAEQKTEFVHLFHQILENTYVERILAYQDEKISFDKESMLTPTTAEVYTRINRPEGNVPINYRLLLVDENWKVYDVVIENVSLVQNYRTQFNDILSKQTPDKLLEILRKKVKDQK
ncbi:MAG: ABC transporter substrate-binding protein [Syntrophales bacterium]|jgi:phospholipid transport system substrate-binding protein|nr:ABC transporter substrate-binding protein [Syntrophales bacterium]NLN60760.1 ABC transporter substrate-binding protein [Deltaproteobacteria bacterium]